MSDKKILALEYVSRHPIQAARLSDSTDSPVVAVDKYRIMQVISNLLSNAAKFSSPGDTVNISVADQVETARVEVSDTGPGIPEDFRERIFDRFSQVDSSDKRAVNGTGLGLNISKAIIERHGGTIDFEAVLGEGTTFFFELAKADR